MASGPLVRGLTRMVCLDERTLSKVLRIVERVGSDEHRCEGRAFGMDRSRGPAAEPDWHPSTEDEGRAR